jgi:hypothetical protein
MVSTVDGRFKDENGRVFPLAQLFQSELYYFQTQFIIIVYFITKMERGFFQAEIEFMCKALAKGGNWIEARNNTFYSSYR